MTGQKTGITPHETKSVWCVTTKLGSWTMKQGVTPVLTGNSAYASIYGAGPDKFALMTGMVDGFGDPDIAQAQAFLKSMDDMYPGPGRFTKAVIKQGNKRFREEGAAYVRSPLTGRRVVAEPGRFYALVNYIIQMMAGEILKMKIVEADAAGLGQYMVMPVHDEIDLDVPTADLPGVVDTLHEVFNDSDLLTVPVTASVETGPNWGEVKEWTG
jgi:DNA polymerase-1